jgi:biopolymer transport protein ExbD
MKRSASAKTRGRQSKGASLSLFPFLAVLICTMGALIVMLVVITRQTQRQAASTAVLAEKSQKQLDLEAAREMAQYRLTELKASREKTEAQLAEARLELGNLEDHWRQLRDQLAQLEAAWSQLESSKNGGGQQRAQAEAELAKLQEEITQAKARLADAQQASRKPATYAVVPYDGPNGTHRRPIYLECRRDSIVLQPEGFVFTEDDFNGPLGPGNPLDVALRALREYLLNRKQIDRDGGNEPYPLLLVRPSGIEAYYAAREAMKSWASDFGYELIGEDWQLQFRSPDRNLADVVRQVVEVARVRQQRLAAAVPRHSDPHTKAKYRPAPYQGGVVRDSGDAVAGGPGPQPRQPQSPFGNRFGGSPSSAASGPKQYEGVLTGGPPPENGTSENPGAPTDSARRFGQTGQGGQDGQTAPSTQAALANQSASKTAQGTFVSSQRARAPNGPTGQPGTPARPGEWIPQQPDSQRESSGEAQVDDQARCLAETRGENWGLRDAASGSVPVTRPIRIDLYRDRLVIVPEKGMASIRVIPLTSRTEDAIDGMISAVWELMDAWGIAGKGMYWRPVLSVYVTPGAESRYRDLATLLDGSGLEVKRK